VVVLRRGEGKDRSAALGRQPGKNDFGREQLAVVFVPDQVLPNPLRGVSQNQVLDRHLRPGRSRRRALHRVEARVNLDRLVAQRSGLPLKPLLQGEDVERLQAQLSVLAADPAGPVQHCPDAATGGLREQVALAPERHEVVRQPRTRRLRVGVR